MSVVFLQNIGKDFSGSIIYRLLKLAKIINTGLKSLFHDLLSGNSLCLFKDKLTHMNICFLHNKIGLLGKRENEPWLVKMVNWYQAIHQLTLVTTVYLLR